MLPSLIAYVISHSDFRLFKLLKGFWRMALSDTQHGISPSLITDLFCVGVISAK